MSISDVIGIVDKIVKLWWDKPKLYFEVKCKQIDNFARSKLSRTKVELSVSNIGGGTLGISRVYLQSLENDFFITSRSLDNGPEKRGTEIMSFSLGANKCQEILLYFKGPYVPNWEKRLKIKTKLVIQDLKGETIGEKELEIYISEANS